MIRIETKLPLCDHNNHLDLSCSEDTPPSYLDTNDIKLDLETHKTSKRNSGLVKNSPKYAHGGTWFQAYKMLEFHM